MDGVTDSMDTCLGGLWELVMDSLVCCGSWGLRVGDNWATVKQQQPVREGASLVAQLVKNPPALQEALVRSLV